MPIPTSNPISSPPTGIRQPNGAVTSDTAITVSVMKITIAADDSVEVRRRIWIVAPPDDTALSSASDSPIIIDVVSAAWLPKYGDSIRITPQKPMPTADQR